MSVLVWILLGILALKVIWNFGVPYAALRKPINPQTGKRGGITVMLEIENLALLLAIGSSWLSAGDSLVNRPLAILGIGGAAILMSYLHFYVVAMIANRWGNRKSRLHPPDPSSE